MLEAADLVRAGVSEKVAVFDDPPRFAEDFEFVRRGLPYDDRAARQVSQLALHGVQNVVRIQSPVAGTTDEVEALPRWCLELGLRSAVVVATSDHSRRLHRALTRSVRGLPVRFTVRASSYSAFDPDAWWNYRHGVRIAIVELQKLLLDVVSHPTQL